MLDSFSFLIKIGFWHDVVTKCSWESPLRKVCDERQEEYFFSPARRRLVPIWLNAPEKMEINLYKPAYNEIVASHMGGVD